MAPIQLLTDVLEKVYGWYNKVSTNYMTTTTRQFTLIAILLFSFLTVLGQSEKGFVLNKTPFIDLSKLNVHQYVELLKVDSNEVNKFNILTVGMERPKNWVTKKDIYILINLIDSAEPAKCVMQIVSSHLPVRESSTIGGQVMNIIEAFKENKAYPTALTSCAKTDAERVKNIKVWWDSQK
ncbi:hypothetical protein [Pedobacter frigiditerrae]|uniref:hypothetical protein n=1 Tax=Pedobacter frigiditerrae TaxID=2530452 RepID=UPI00292E95DF|nr:hypothetical protein [Pedobacter frigiditerrae]